MIKPIKDNLLIKKIEQDNKSKSGVILYSKTEIQDNIGLVIEVGDEVKSILKNDKVIFENYKGVEIKFEEEDFLIVNEKYILGKIKS